MVPKDDEMKRHGFTLVELLVAIGIVAILSAIAVPSFLYFIRKAKFSEVVQAADRYKAGVAACVERSAGDLAECNGGTHEVPDNITTPFGRVASLTVAAGVITIVPVASDGIEAADTYVLQPTYSNNSITWQVSGGACTNGLVSCN